MNRICTGINRRHLISPPEDFSLERAMELQKRCSKMVRRRSNDLDRIQLVTGLDSAYEGNTAFGAAVTLDYETLETRETGTAKGEAKFPYVPGFLAFREAPILIAAAKELKKPPDIYLVDGQGFAHPRRFGLACHIGVALDTPTIGVAKSRLSGTVFGSRLKDRGESIGAIVRRQSGRPLYVSIGHKISLRDSIRIVRRCFCTGSKDPITLAHIEASKMRMSSR